MENGFEEETRPKKTCEEAIVDKRLWLIWEEILEMLINSGDIK